MQHVTSFTMFDSYDDALFTLQTRDFEKIQDGPQCVKRCILIVNWQESGLQTEYHANDRFRLRRSNSVLLQLQFEAFYPVNLLNAKWKVVPARNSHYSGWKKRKPM